MKLLLTAVVGLGLMVGVVACQGTDISGTAGGGSGNVPTAVPAPREPGTGNTAPTMTSAMVLEEVINRLAAKDPADMSWDDIKVQINEVDPKLAPAVIVAAEKVLTLLATTEGNEAAKTWWVARGTLPWADAQPLLLLMVEKLRATEGAAAPAPPRPGTATGAKATDLAGILGGYAPTERIAADLVADKLSGNTACTTCAADLEALKTYIADTCGAAGNDCPPALVKFNTALTTAQVRGQAPIPVTYPQAQDVSALYAKMREPGGGGGAPTVDSAMVLEEVINRLSAKDPADLSWEDIKVQINEANPAQGAAVIVAAEKVLTTLATDEGNEFAKTWQSGGTLAWPEAQPVLLLMVEKLRQQ